MSKVEATRILYMDDDEGLARLMKKRLRRKGYQVDIVESGEMGLQMLQTASYDIVLVDYTTCPVYAAMKSSAPWLKPAPFLLPSW